MGRARAAVQALPLPSPTPRAIPPFRAGPGPSVLLPLTSTWLPISWGKKYIRAISFVSSFLSLSHFPDKCSAPASWLHASPLNPSQSSCWPHRDAETASLKIGLFPNTALLSACPAAGPSVREADPCVHVPSLQPSVL